LARVAEVEEQEMGIRGIEGEMLIMDLHLEGSMLRRRMFIPRGRGPGIEVWRGNIRDE
jgi:hypothetical protein